MDLVSFQGTFHAPKNWKNSPTFDDLLEPACCCHFLHSLRHIESVIQNSQKCQILFITFECALKSASFNEPKLLELLLDSLSRFSLSLRKPGRFKRACNDLLHAVNYKTVMSWHLYAYTCQSN